MITEKDYVIKTTLTHRKRYAQFFTPELIADFMAKWVLGGDAKRRDILEPALGLGVFTRALSAISDNLNVTGYDIDPTIYSYAVKNFSDAKCGISFFNENYLTSSWHEKYDGIICNPPYLKFHDYDNATLVPLVNKELGTSLNGFTNIYTLFLLKSLHQLNEGGRLAYIIPSEFLNADYGVAVKKALLDSGMLRHIIIVDFTQCAFDDALTTACIVLCERTTDIEEVRFSNIDSTEKLSSSLENYIAVRQSELNPGIKWKQYYEDTQSSRYQHLVPFATFAKVSRGIATGSNDYFTFKASKQDLFSIPDHCLKPCICHAVDVPNLIFTQEDFNVLANKDKTVFLFDGCSDDENSNVQNYINIGVEREVNKKYLTASRKPWYSIENRVPSPIWVSVFNRQGLRFVRNTANVYNLTTFHCVYSKEIIDTDILFMYLLTDVAKEIFLDNSRQYGNGLIKFEPNDLNKGNVVDLRLLSDEESDFLLNAYHKLQHYGSINNDCIKLVDGFFREKYTDKIIDVNYYKNALDELKSGAVKVAYKPRAVRIKQLNFLDLFGQYALDNITENAMVREDFGDTYGKVPQNRPVIDMEKNVLISLVKKDNEKMFLDRTATIYYTGKKFPTTVALNKLYYFMPYIKGKGVRDLWLIKIARLGYRKEGTPEEDRNDLRLVFELEYVDRLFDDYQPAELTIWRTFTDTTIGRIQSINRIFHEKSTN